MGIFGGSPQDQVDLGALTERVAKLEATVARLQAQLAAAPVAGGSVGSVAGPDESWLGEVRALKADGKLIPAIKLYREHTGSGLREAKDAVEAMP